MRNKNQKSIVIKKSDKPEISDNKHVADVMCRRVRQRRAVEQSIERKRMADELGLPPSMIGL
jgi:hypothetical protein